MKTLELKNGRYYDENNNSWNADIESLESATKKSGSLINCSDCRACSDCSYCSACSDCRACRDCRDCSDCSYCSACRACSACSACRACSACSDCRDCSACSDCRYCSACRDCRDCSDYKSNPCRFVSKKIGSRKSNTTIYWLDGNEQVICGCFRGNLNEFENAVNKTHANNLTYLSDYTKLIELVRYIITNH